jgi:hypothetical protein
MHAHLDAVDLRLDSVDMIQRSLEEAFGSATDAGRMHHTVVVGGEYGLRRFYAVIVEPFLDRTDRYDYAEVFQLLNDSCRALGRKCANYIKVLRLLALYGQ